ncbi:MAG: hypothetical protein IKN65_06955 [Clostridia bacterium]|nr:hypothetical protein [Clostridia bacterium]
MSYYYNYYIGYKKDGKIYPWGPYNANGKLKPMISRSRSFASDLHEEFYTVSEEESSEELRKEFEYEDWDKVKHLDVKYLSEKDLPVGSYIKTGYFLIKDVQAYEDDKYNNFEGFYDILSPEIYAAKLQHEMMFGKNQPIKDDEGYEYTKPNASDYMYYAYPDYNTKEYESFILRQLIEALRDYHMWNRVEYVVLETEG